MPKVCYLTHMSGRTHGFFESKEAALDFMDHYNLFREPDCHLLYCEEEIGLCRKTEQIPGWYCEIDMVTGYINDRPRIHPFNPDRRPKHIVASHMANKLAVVSFESAEHAIWAAEHERKQQMRKNNDSLH